MMQNNDDGQYYHISFDVSIISHLFDYK